MPCYEVNLMIVEFKAKYKDILIKALESLGLLWDQTKDKVFTSNFTFDLANQKVEYPKGYQNQINQIKRKYSEIVLEQVAKKRRWILKRGAESNFQLLKY